MRHRAGGLRPHRIPEQRQRHLFQASCAQKTSCGRDLARESSSFKPFLFCQVGLWRLKLRPQQSQASPVLQPLSRYQRAHHQQGLNKNLNAITAPGVDVASFYPRCFDLSDPRQLDLFISDFNQTSILNCIQKHAEYFSSLLKEQEIDIQNIFSTNLQIGLNFDKNKFRMLER